MVKLMLHHACQIAFHPFIMGLHVFIQPLHMNTSRTDYLLVNSRKRKATLFRRSRLRIIILNNVRIDIYVTEALILWQILTNHIEVNHNHTNRLTYLRSSKSYTFTLCQCVPHISNQLLQIRIIGRNVLGYFTKHGMTIYINR